MSSQLIFFFSSETRPKPANTEVLYTDKGPQPYKENYDG